jgi:hypothetical protein
MSLFELKITSKILIHIRIVNVWDKIIGKLDKFTFLLKIKIAYLEKERIPIIIKICKI